MQRRHGFADLQRAEIAAREAADRERTGRKEAERAAAVAAARAEQATKGCCQSNGNLSPLGAGVPTPGVG